MRQIIREACSEWHTLPDTVQTDNGLGLASGPNDPFPGLLTLWLRGLGVRQCFIRPGCPADQPHVKRSHQTLDGWTFGEDDRTNVTRLQQALDRERKVHNHWFPSRASDCARRPPLTAHPKLLYPRRPYQPELELALFDMQRVYFDPIDKQWVFLTNTEAELVRRQSKGLDIQTLMTGHETHPVELPQPIQLTLPFLVP